LLLLPGLDGTDVFFRPLVASLPGWITPVVVPFPTGGANGYPDLLALVRTVLADAGRCYVLGWSFSGPLALMLAAREPESVRGVILASSFVTPPRPLYTRLRWGAVEPVIWLIRACRRIPVWLSRRPTDRLRQDKTETWKRVRAGTVAARIRVLLHVDARAVLRNCPCPVLCVAGTSDRIVPARNVEEIVSVRPSTFVQEIDGGHFAIYTNPRAAAAAIAWFLTHT
jgi:pimeloyl-ACP methyl ester carboxylesterase